MVNIYPEKYSIREYMVHGKIYILKKYLIREYMVHGRYTF